MVVIDRLMDYSKKPISIKISTPEGETEWVQDENGRLVTKRR